MRPNRCRRRRSWPGEWRPRPNASGWPMPGPAARWSADDRGSSASATPSHRARAGLPGSGEPPEPRRRTPDPTGAAIGLRPSPPRAPQAPAPRVTRRRRWRLTRPRRWPPPRRWRATLRAWRSRPPKPQRPIPRAPPRRGGSPPARHEWRLRNRRARWQSARHQPPDGTPTAIARPDARTWCIRASHDRCSGAIHADRR